MSAGLYTRFHHSFRTFSDRPFVEGFGRTMTYAEVESQASRFAAILQTRGVKAGDRLLLQTDKSVEALILYIACVRLGAIYLPLNVDYTESEVAHVVIDAQPVLAVCREIAVGLFAKIGQGALEVTTLADLVADIRDEDGVPAEDRSANEPVAILYTSGTTGKPKGAMISAGNLVSNGETLAELWRFTAEDRLIHALPIFHVHGLFVAVHCALFTGATLVFLPKFDSAEVIQLMDGATVLMGVPTFYTRLLADPTFTREAAARMRLFVVGSAPLSAESFRAFEERTGHRVLERYGMTETGIITSNPYDGDRRPGSVGLPLPGVELRCLRKRQVMPRGSVGIVEVRGPNVFQGYWRNPEKTASEFRSDGYFSTGDLGLIEVDGYLRLVGREKDLIITGGLNVYPAEIEAVLEVLPEILECAVIGVPHPDLGEAVVAVVQTSSACFDAAAVRSYTKGALAGFKVPKDFIPIDALPRNTMGKLHKKRLRQNYADFFNS